MRAVGVDRAVGLGRGAGADRTVGASRAFGASRRVGLAPNGAIVEDEMYGYQVAGSNWLRAMPAALLADEMGTGKSVQVLRALSRLGRTIVVCPASVILVWVQQIVRWRPELRAAVGEDLRRPEEGEVLIISYDSLPEPPPGSRVLIQESMKGVTLVLDECHKVKSYRAQRTKKVRRLAAQCDRVWGLSGTPMLGSPEDLWGVLSSLKLAGIFDGWEEFVGLCNGKKRYMRDRKSGALREIGHTWGEIDPEVGERLKRVMLRRRRADVLPDLPGKQYLDVPVAAPADLRKFLDAVKERWDEVDQSDLPPFELLSEARAALARSRIPAALEYVDTLADELPTLVFSAHVDPVLAVGKLRDAAAITGQTSLPERRRAVELFQAGMVRILALTIDAGGEGLTLTRAGAVVFVDRDYTPAMNQQAEDRAVRLGQDHQSVLVARLVSDHPLDLRMQEILDEKQRLISGAIG